MFSILNMSSSPAPRSPDPAIDPAIDPSIDGSGIGSPDLTARARIRDAAITRFAADGVSGTSVRAIAADAGVSPALVIHHFGSKDALRVACDQQVAATIRENKRRALTAGASLDPLAALRAAQSGPPLLAYLARTLVDTSPHVAELVDELVEDAVGYMEDGVASGTLTPTDDPRGRAIVMTMWSLGALVLHEHIARVMDVDLTGDAGELAAWAAPAVDILGRGLLTPETSERIRSAFPPAGGRDAR